MSRTQRHAKNSCLACEAVIIAVAFVLPYPPFVSVLGFAPIPVAFYPIIVAIILVYMTSAEILKQLFFRRAARYDTCILTEQL